DRLDGFVLVSSDSDFTRLASRLRESGMTVYGVGERKTPEAFRAACDRFIYSDVLGLEEEAEDETPEATGAAGAGGAAEVAATAEQARPKRRTAKELRGDNALVHALRAAVASASDD